LAKRQRVARQIQGRPFRRAGIPPVWYGVSLGLIIGVSALVGWNLFADSNNTASASNSDPRDSGSYQSIFVDGVEMAALATPNPATLTRMPVPTPEEIEAKERRENLARRQHVLSETIVPFLNTHCIDCHGPDSDDAGITVHELKSVDQFLTERKMWERVYRMVNSGAMPPSDHEPQPEKKQREEVAAIMFTELYEFDCDLVYNPGRSTVQRLNRSEYNNTVQDLFGIDLSPADKFPADDVGDGFDNIGDVLSLPPLLMEKYLAAAEDVVGAVIDTRDFSTPRDWWPKGWDRKDAGEDGLRKLRVLASHGKINDEFEIEVAGEYEIVAQVSADQAGDEKAKFALHVGDQRLQEFEVQENRKRETFKQKHKFSAGTQSVSVEFLNDFYDENNRKNGDRNLAVGDVKLIGPIGGGSFERTEIHRRFITAEPKDGISVVDAAQAVLRPILNRAFRKDVPDAVVFRDASLVRKAVDEMGETYEGGLSLALQAMLVAPEFLFRLEEDPVDGQLERQLDDFEIATRLSYFLWSTMPDDELFAAARSGDLRKPDVMRQQVRRMLKHDKAEALVQNFAAQWLNLRNLNDVEPNTDIFKTFTPELRQDMRRETELLFRTVMQEDRSIEELLSADFTFVNKRLAEHYGIKGVDSDKFERVSLKGTNRSGVLTHASILTLTSNPGRTSPVKRGKWIMENIFGEGPPPPPPGVPELEETAKVSPDLTLREQLAKHREDPGCAACHKVMDPLGLGLENFDAVGAWRTEDGKQKIDASGSLPSGETFKGPLELIQIVRKRKEKFFTTMSEKMLTYAIGRGTQYYDKCTVDECVAQLGQHGNRFSVLIETIVLSDPFLKRSIAEEKLSQTAQTGGEK